MTALQIDWAARRVEIKATVASVDVAYMALARALFEVATLKVEGELPFVAWGYKTFEDYVQGDLDLHPRKAYALKRIWDLLEGELRTLAPDVRLRFERLGWTKLRELSRVLTLKNSAQWLKVAEEHTFAKVADLVTAYKEKARQQSRKARESVAGASFEAPAPPATDRGDSDLPAEEDAPHHLTHDANFEVPTEPQGAGAAPERGDMVIPEEVVDGIPMDTAVADDLKRRTFAFFPRQYQAVEQALEIAKRLSGSSMDSHNLSLICVEFASHNLHKRGRSVQERVEILARLSEALQLDVIAFNPKDGECVFGLEAARRLLGTPDPSTGTPPAQEEAAKS